MTHLSIPDMSCNHCKATVEQTIKALDPAASLIFDMPARTVTVNSATAPDTLRAALKTAGYEAAVA
jgi:copper chaperone